MLDLKWIKGMMAMIIAAFGLIACGDDDEGGKDPEPQKPSLEVKVKSTSITEGEEIEAEEQHTLTVEFTHAVKVADASKVTLNGKALSPRSVAGSPTKIEVALPQLEQDTKYAFVIADGGIVADEDGKSSVQAFTLNFRTFYDPIISITLPDNEAARLCRAMGWGWNLGNHFDSSSGEDNKLPMPKDASGNYTYWDGAKPTQQLYKNLKAIGAGTVRIPVTWGCYQGASPEYIIDKTFAADVKRNVDWAIEQGLYVVLNTHHDEYWLDAINAAKDPALNEKIKARITATWKQIATQYKDYGDHLIFEAFNEIHDEGWGWTGGFDYKPAYAIVNEWNQLAVDVIRATGGNNASRWIGVEGFCANPEFTYKDFFVIPKDPAKHIMVGVHSYDPYNFCTPGTIAGWGHGYKGNDSDENELANRLAKLRNMFLEKNIPVYMGEYGVTTRSIASQEPFRHYYLEYFTRAAYYQGIPCMLWDNHNLGSSGERFKFINHNDGTLYEKDLVKMMIKAATDPSEKYNVKTIYRKAPKK